MRKKIDLKYQFQVVKKYKKVEFIMIACNNCGMIFESEKALVNTLITENELGEEQGELFTGQDYNSNESQLINGCPKCLTDSYLMDKE